MDKTIGVYVRSSKYQNLLLPNLSPSHRPKNYVYMKLVDHRNIVCFFAIFFPLEAFISNQANNITVSNLLITSKITSNCNC